MISFNQINGRVRRLVAILVMACIAIQSQAGESKRDIKIESLYLNIPIKNGAPKRKVTMRRDGFDFAKNDIELADGPADWWAFVDVSDMRGKTITLSVDSLPADSKALDAIDQSDLIKGAADLYREPLREQFHFSSRRGWNNDPNGLTYFNGEYHMFYQHNPYGWEWGNMHWGHAVSRDMVHWHELGDVLAPDKFGPMFSGSAVIDWKNTSGLGQPGHPAQVLLYTAAGDPTVQCIASGTDGRHYTKFSGNPIVKQIASGNRDPQVIWHEQTKKWVMVLYASINNIDTVQFLSSPDLKNWTIMSHTDGFAECPNFFEMPVDGDTANKKWVLAGASSEYMVGRFDGNTFTPETGKLPGHRGKGFYAAQTFSDIPARDGRRIQIGWMQAPTPGMPFNQSMSIPFELKLTQTPDGPRLARLPVKELKSLRRKSRSFAPATFGPDSAKLLADVPSGLVEVRAEFKPNDAKAVAFNVRGATIVYDAKNQQLFVNGQHAPAPLKNGKEDLWIYCDRAVMEVFGSGGLTYIPMPFIPKSNDLSGSVAVEGGSAKFSKLEVHELESAWK